MKCCNKKIAFRGYGIECHFYLFSLVVYRVFWWYKLCTIFRYEIVMLHPAYVIKDIKTILELNDSARHTLLFILDSFSGAQFGKINRSGMSAAEKQKLKRGIAELRKKSIIVKSTSQQSVYSLNPLFMKTTQIPPRDAHYIHAGMHKEYHRNLLGILTAIEHFFEDFYSKEFIIKYKVYTNTPRFPHHVFIDNVLDARYYLVNGLRYRGYNLLVELIQIAREIKFHTGVENNLLGLSKEQAEAIAKSFSHLLSKDCFVLFFNGSYEGKALHKFMVRWFMENYPELTI